MFIPAYKPIEQSPQRLVISLALQPQMPCFAGHFEGLPVLPGVVQIGWVMALAQRHFETALVHRGLRSVKFQQLVRPPVDLTLTVDWLRERELLKFSYRNLRGQCSSGGISVSEAP